MWNQQHWSFSHCLKPLGLFPPNTSVSYTLLQLTFSFTSSFSASSSFLMSSMSFKRDPPSEPHPEFIYNTRAMTSNNLRLRPRAVINIRGQFKGNESHWDSWGGLLGLSVGLIQHGPRPIVTPQINQLIIPPWAPNEGELYLWQSPSPWLSSRTRHCLSAVHQPNIRTKRQKKIHDKCHNTRRA